MARPFVRTLAVLTGFLLYAWAATWTFNASVQIALPLPPWSRLALPPTLYAAIVLLGIARSRVAGFALFCSVHALLALATTLIYAEIGSLPYDVAAVVAFWAFPTAAVLQVVWTIALVLPFLGALERRQIRRRRSRKAPRFTPRSRSAAPLVAANDPGVSVFLRDRRGETAAAVPAPIEENDIAEAIAPRAEEIVSAPARLPLDTTPRMDIDEPVLARTVDVPPAGPHPEPFRLHNDREVASASPVDVTPTIEMRPTIEMAPAARVTPAVMPPRPPEDVRKRETPSSRPLERTRATPRARSEDDLRVRFERIADQLPAAAFAIPLPEVGARLVEPHVIRLARAPVVAQLAEGLVRVEWEAVRDQFPDDVFAMPASQVGEALSEGRLTLPLDEIVGQLSPSTFSAGVADADVHGLESFPLPFEPPAPAAAPEASAVPVPAPAAVTPAPAPAVPPKVVAASVAPAPPKTVAPVPVPPAPPKIEAPRPVPAAPSRTEVPAPVPAAPPKPRVPTAPPPRRPAASSVPEVPRPVEQRGAAVPAAVVEMARRAAALVAPFGRFDVTPTIVEGTPLIVAAGRDVSPHDIGALAGRLLPALIDEHNPWPVEQLTLRRGDSVVVVTPGSEGTLVMATARRGRLALLEILSRRAAAGVPRPRPAAPVRLGAGAETTLADLSHLAPPEIGQLADTLAPFRPLTPSVFRDGAAGVTLYLLLPAALPPVPVAELAAALCAAVSDPERGPALAGVESMVLRIPGQRVVVKPVETSHRSVVVVTAAAIADRPALLHHQVERAAVLLAAA